MTEEIGIFKEEQTRTSGCWNGYLIKVQRRFARLMKTARRSAARSEYVISKIALIK